MGNQEDLPRDDDDVAAAAEACLAKSPSFAECSISCRCREGTLTLRGRVPRYSLKYAARRLVEGIDGVRNVHNQLEVMPLPLFPEAYGSDRPAPPQAGSGAD